MLLATSACVSKGSDVGSQKSVDLAMCPAEALAAGLAWRHGSSDFAQVMGKCLMNQAEEGGMLGMT